jgi:hypothetical protein
MELTLLQHQRRAAVGGAVAGGAGGVAMVALVVSRSLLAGSSPWLALKVPSAAYLGTAVLHGEPAVLPVVIGLMLHLFVAQLWGFAFGVAVYGLSRVATLWAGIALGLASHLVMGLVMVPLCGLRSASTAVPGALWLHLLFGLLTALSFLAFQRRLDAATVKALIDRARGERP